MNKIYFLDDKDNIVDEDHATHFYIHECDENGESINHMHFIINRTGKPKEKIVYTSEEEELLKNINYDDKSK